MLKMLCKIMNLLKLNEIMYNILLISKIKIGRHLTLSTIYRNINNLIFKVIIVLMKHLNRSTKKLLIYCIIV